MAEDEKKEEQAEDSGGVSESEIDALVNELAGAGVEAGSPETGAEPAAPATDSSQGVDPSEIDSLVSELAALNEDPPDAAPAADTPVGSGVSESEIDDLLKQAESSTPAAIEAVEKKEAPANITSFDLPRLDDGGSGEIQNRIDLIKDVNLHVRVELGRRKMYIEDILKLGSGAVVELDKLAGDPLDILVNERLVARGEVLILNDNFCVRVTEIVKRPDRPAE